MVSAFVRQQFTRTHKFQLHREFDGHVWAATIWKAHNWAQYNGTDSKPLQTKLLQWCVHTTIEAIHCEWRSSFILDVRHVGSPFYVGMIGI